MYQVVAVSYTQYSEYGYEDTWYKILGIYGLHTHVYQKKKNLDG